MALSPFLKKCCIGRKKGRMHGEVTEARFAALGKARIISFVLSYPRL